MSYHDDWFMRQIEMIISTLLAVLFRDRTIEETEEGRQLTSLLQQGKICQAEDLLWTHLDEGETNWLLPAVEFYQRANKLSDTALEAQNFSRAEIREGLERICRQYGIDIFV